MWMFNLFSQVKGLTELASIIAAVAPCEAECMDGHGSQLKPAKQIRQL